ncbi:putative G-protein coupled receptor [Apostichopus japonicus]|uniref:Putative G-protein coupled receptor n=1 Tax=Stichopus japonicus TaxID=307972 RepID=A0A2G8LMT5_STIJA|nr:putative G-protein coupled receptor [Apostichopus japonicus]
MNTSDGVSKMVQSGDDGSSTVTPQYSDYSDYQYGPVGPFYSTVFAIFILIILMSATGNSLVIFIVLRFRAMRNSVTNFYIMNVALSDIVYTFMCVPVMAYIFFWHVWHFGNFFCKLFAVLQTATVQVTCTTLTVMTVDRYYVIISPLTSRQTRTIPKAAGISVAIWIFSFVTHTPLAFLYEVDEYSSCNVRQGVGSGYLIFLFLSTYVIPLTIIGVCYGLILSHLWKLSRNGSSKETSVQTATKKWKTTKIVLAVILLFAFCWLPIHIVNIWQGFQSREMNISVRGNLPLFIP